MSSGVEQRNEIRWCEALMREIDNSQSNVKTKGGTHDSSLLQQKGWRLVRIGCAFHTCHGRMDGQSKRQRTFFFLKKKRSQKQR